MSQREWLIAEMAIAYISQSEPKSRVQRFPLPAIAPVLEAAKQRRRDYLDALHPWTRSTITEHEREAAQEAIDSLDEEAYDSSND